MAREKVLVAPRGFPGLCGKGPYDGSCLKHKKLRIFFFFSAFLQLPREQPGFRGWRTSREAVARRRGLLQEVELWQ